MIFNSGFFKKKRRKEKSRVEDDWWLKVYKLWIREARAVWLWSCLSLALRILIGLLLDLASYVTENKQDSNELSTFRRQVLETSSVFAGWAIGLMPPRVATNQAPGFIFSNPIILLWVLDKTNIIPNLPSRACEYMLGRIRLVDLVTVTPIHFVTCVSTAFFLQKFFPDNIVPLALEPIQYDHDGDPWIIVSFVYKSLFHFFY